jgi:erythromycin esterase-like protein
MPTLVIQLTIADYTKWRSAFDKGAPLRKNAGLKNWRVYRDADSADKVLVWSEAQDLTRAREAVLGPSIQKAMQEAGVIGPPRVHVIS